MKPLPLILATLCLALCSCATDLYNPRTGGKLAHFGADADLIEYSGGGVKCRIVNHRPSTTIRAGGSVVGTATAGAMGIIMAGGVR